MRRLYGHSNRKKFLMKRRSKQTLHLWKLYREFLQRTTMRYLFLHADMGESKLCNIVPTLRMPLVSRESRGQSSSSHIFRVSPTGTRLRPHTVGDAASRKSTPDWKGFPRFRNTFIAGIPSTKSSSYRVGCPAIQVLVEIADKSVSRRSVTFLKRRRRSIRPPGPVGRSAETFQCDGRLPPRTRIQELRSIAKTPPTGGNPMSPCTRKCMVVLCTRSKSFQRCSVCIDHRLSKNSSGCCDHKPAHFVEGLHQIR